MRLRFHSPGVGDAELSLRDIDRSGAIALNGREQEYLDHNLFAYTRIIVIVRNKISIGIHIAKSIRPPVGICFANWKSRANLLAFVDGGSRTGDICKALPRTL